MAVTANQRIRSRNARNIVGVPVTATKNLYQGTMAFAIAATGFADSAIAAGANSFLGIVKDQADNSAGASGDVVADIYTEGEFELQGTGFTQALVGDKIYAVDNFTVNATASSQTLIGRCVEFISATKIMVAIEAGVQA